MAKAAKKAATKQTEEPKKAAAKAPKKAVAKSSGKGDSKGGGGKANAGLMAPLHVSPELGKIVGNAPLPRTEIIKKIWEYIKGNNLQDQNNKRMINADEQLKVVFAGKDQVSMFELAKIVNNHVKK